VDAYISCHRHELYIIQLNLSPTSHNWDAYTKFSIVFHQIFDVFHSDSEYLLLLEKEVQPLNLGIVRVIIHLVIIRDL